METLLSIIGALIGFAFAFACLIFAIRFLALVVVYFGWTILIGALISWAIMYFAFGSPGIPFKSMSIGAAITTLTWHWLYKGTFWKDLWDILVNSVMNMFSISSEVYQQGGDRNSTSSSGQNPSNKTLKTTRVTYKPIYDKRQKHHRPRFLVQRWFRDFKHWL
jgi:hypothetical protein